MQNIKFLISTKFFHAVFPVSTKFSSSIVPAQKSGHEKYDMKKIVAELIKQQPY